MSHAKIITITDAVHRAQKLKKSGKKVVTTNGCFDVVHVGHIRSLRMAKDLGDVLMVGVNTDASVRANKGKLRPIIPHAERAELIASLEMVDYVFLFNTKTSIPWLAKLQPTIHVKGSDRKIEEVPERKTVEKYGGKIVLVPHTGKHSTTGIIEKICAL
jgi:rfaE bifunctional protein nucleotidyltransferase chain/domain